ncbi:two-component system, OmpR family, phosphate regulon sensor histidine kinase PhoR [Rhizobiales bacterium GAS188]|nr:two-component system, OmpR family, phosphate regulon sensor histidine kinase PhoR [Rhizobiales bacterium GAS188]
MVAATERQIEANEGTRLRYGPVAGAGIATLLIGCVLAALGAPLLLPMAAGLAGMAICALLRPRRRDPVAAAEAQSQETLRLGIAAILSGIADPVVVLDPQGNVSMFNAKAKAALPQLEVARSLSFAVRSPEVVSAVERVLREGAVAETEFHEKVPVERSFEVHATPVRIEAAPTSLVNPGTEIVVLFRDVTAARRLERMRVDFVANASHELRTPLASLYGFIETIEGPARNDPAAQKRFLAIMREQARRMSRLIDDLLSLSRIELKEHVHPTDDVRLDTVLREVIDTLSPLALECKTQIIAEGLGRVVVRGDRDELIRVFENLIENAVKYGQSGGRVEVSLTEKERVVGVTVRDYGPGIAPEHLPRLTERFYRVDVVESRQKGGTGLGLALVKHILNRHKARLVVRSELGAGASFEVVFPKALAAS